MDIKSFRNGAVKANKKSGADGVRSFLGESKTLQFLSSKKLVDITRPYIQMLEANELVPSLAVAKICEAIAKANLEAPSTSSKPTGVIVTILDSNGNVHLDDEGEELMDGFETLDAAEHWASNKLWNLTVCFKAVIEDTRGETPIVHEFTFDMADRRKSHKSGGKTFTHSNKYGGRKTGFEVKSKAWTPKFSRG